MASRAADATRSTRRCRSTKSTSAAGSATRRRPARWLTYRELAHQLVEYCQKMGYTHLELMPVSEHPFTGSWGYQTVGYFAATSRYGTPEDFMYFVDHCHQNGIGVLHRLGAGPLPAKTATACGYFDGTALYEHADPRQGEHPDWGTLIFNYGRNEVRNFLHLERPVLARQVPHRRPARRRRGLDAVPRLQPRRRASGFPTSTAAARTSRRSRSSRNSTSKSTCSTPAC